jgi:long-chain acyl-CoA synthetase
LILRSDEADPAGIVRRANATLSPSQQVRRWGVWTEPDFPRTPTHKVRKALVRDALLSRGPGNSEVSLTGGKDLKELDSLGRIALLGELEERYQIEFDEASLTPDTTIRDLEQMIQRGEPAADYPYPRWALRWPCTWLRWLAHYLLVAPCIGVMCRPRPQRLDRLRGLRGPVLFASNHIAMRDPAVILYALPGGFKRRLAIAMGGERLRGFRHGLEGATWIGKLRDRMKYLLVTLLFNVFALPQKSGFRRSFAYAGEAADRGFSLLVFPEGRTTSDGAMNPFMPGIGLLAANLNIPVVPVRIEGEFDLPGRNRYFSRHGSVRVTFGQPIEIPRGADPSQITRELEACVRELS